MLYSESLPQTIDSPTTFFSDDGTSIITLSEPYSTGRFIADNIALIPDYTEATSNVGPSGGDRMSIYTSGAESNSQVAYNLLETGEGRHSVAKSRWAFVSNDSLPCPYLITQEFYPQSYPAEPVQVTQWVEVLGEGKRTEIRTLDPLKDGKRGWYNVWAEVLPVGLMVDGNRDGVMSFNNVGLYGGDGTAKDKPYRFWINDDQDTPYGEETETVPVQQADDHDDKIQSARDCEDLARLWLNLKGMTQVFKDGTIRVTLRFRNTDSTDPQIRVFRAVETDGGLRYVQEPSWGVTQATAPFNQALTGTSGGSVVSSGGYVTINRELWGGGRRG